MYGRQHILPQGKVWPLRRELQAPVPPYNYDQIDTRVGFAVFLLIAMIIGMHSSYGIFFIVFVEQLQVNMSSAAFMGTLAYGVLLMLGPLSNFFITYMMTEERHVALIGTLACAIGLFTSSFTAYFHFPLMYLSYSGLFGIGSSLVYTAAMHACSDSDGELLPVAVKMQLYATALGMTIFTLGGQLLIEAIGWDWTLRIYSMVVAGSVIVCLIIPSKPGKWPSTPKKIKQTPIEDPDVSWMCKMISLLTMDSCVVILNLSIWRNHDFILWAVATSLVMMAYHVPYVLLAHYAMERGNKRSHSIILLFFLALSTGMARFFWINLLRYVSINERLLFQAGVATMGFAFLFLCFAYKYIDIALCTIIMGVAEGLVSILLPPLTVVLVSSHWVTAAWSYLLLVNGFFFTIGPLITASLREWTGNYNTPLGFFAALMLLAIILILLMRSDLDREDREWDGRVPPVQPWVYMNGTYPAPSLYQNILRESSYPSTPRTPKDYLQGSGNIIAKGCHCREAIYDSPFARAKSIQPSSHNPLKVSDYCTHPQLLKYLDSRKRSASDPSLSTSQKDFVREAISAYLLENAMTWKDSSSPNTSYIPVQSNDILPVPCAWNLGTVMTTNMNNNPLISDSSTVTVVQVQPNADQPEADTTPYPENASDRGAINTDATESMASKTNDKDKNEYDLGAQISTDKPLKTQTTPKQTTVSKVNQMRLIWEKMHSVNNFQAPKDVTINDLRSMSDNIISQAQEELDQDDMNSRGQNGPSNRRGEYFEDPNNQKREKLRNCPCVDEKQRALIQDAKPQK